MHTQLLVADPHPRLAEVDLQLLPRRRLEPHCRASLRLQFTPPARDPAFDVAKTEHHPMFGRQFLTDDVGVAAVSEEPLTQPILKPIQRRAPHRLSKRRRTTLAKISSHRVACAAELPRKPLGSPAKTVQPHHRRHLVRLQHLLSPRHGTTRDRVAGFERFHHSLLFTKRGQFLRSPDTSGEGVTLPLGAGWCPGR